MPADPELGHPVPPCRSGWRTLVLLLQVDAYQGFSAVLHGETHKLAICVVHALRKFCEVYVSHTLPITEEALRRIAALYVIEAEIRGTSAEHRRSVFVDTSKRRIWRSGGG